MVCKICLYTYIIASYRETVMRCVESHVIIMSIISRMRLIVIMSVASLTRLNPLSYET